MHAVGILGPAHDPTACVNHQLTVTTQVWSSDHQQSERRPFTQTKHWRLRDVGLLELKNLIQKMDLKM